MPRKISRALQAERAKDAEVEAEFYGQQLGTLYEEAPVRKSTPIMRPAEFDVAAKAPKADSLPDIREFDHADTVECASLLEEYAIYKEQADACEKRMKRIKEQLRDHCESYGTGGMRSGSLAVYYRGMVTRKTLDKTLLLENGCPLEALEASYREGTPFLDMSIRAIKE
jgi:hypothetical protein